MTNCNCKWGGCIYSKIGFILLVIGGINWGLVGLGTLIGTPLNVVNMLLGAWPMLEAIVYVLVGIAAIMKLIGCKCKICKAACANCTCGTGGAPTGNM